jgi:hypothetical protein
VFDGNVLLCAQLDHLVVGKQVRGWEWLDPGWQVSDWLVVPEEYAFENVEGGQKPLQRVIR